MRFGLPSFLGGFFELQKQPKKQKSNSRRRKLLAEPLESRFALSTLVGGVVVPDEPVLPSDPVAALTSPLGVDLPPTDPPGNPPGNPPSGNTPPVIHDLTITLEGNWYVVRGRVTDNVDPTGYTVQLTGVLSGSAMVGTDDRFSYSFIFMPGLHGSIFAQTHDIQGLSSNEPMVSF